MTAHCQIAPSIEELLWSWPGVIRSAPEGWPRSFALSIARQSKRKSWTPTEKQLDIMKRMVAEHYREPPSEQGAEWSPIDEEDAGF